MLDPLQLQRAHGSQHRLRYGGWAVTGTVCQQSGMATSPYVRQYKTPALHSKLNLFELIKALSWLAS